MSQDAEQARQAYLREKEVIGHAFTSNIVGSGRGRCFALAGQQLHTNAGNDQVYLECSRGHRCGVVASEHFWTFSFALPHPHWKVSEPDSQIINGIRFA
jgi:hypothetical protein